MTLRVITGPMMAEKSTAVYRCVARALRAKKTVTAFVPTVDTRSKGQVVTHSGKSLADLGVTPKVVPASRYIYTEVRDDIPDLMVIDEAQFFDRDLPKWVGKLMHLTHIVVAGLDTNAEGEPFDGPMGDLMCLADTVEKLTAICHCGAEATRTACKVDKKPGVVLVGGNESYVPMCLGCWTTHRQTT